MTIDVTKRGGASEKMLRGKLMRGIYLDQLPDDHVIRIVTEAQRQYLLVKKKGKVLLSGHPEFCPNPIEVREMRGGIAMGNIENFVGLGRRMEYTIAPYRLIDRVITTKVVRISLANNPKVSVSLPGFADAPFGAVQDRE